jgi:hypothetical protein
MANTFLERAMKAREPDDDGVSPPPLGGTRAQAVHRLQIGLSGIAGMVLMIALADTILSRADEAEASSVPEAAATVEAVETDAPKNDPLAEAGVVPDLPASPTPSASTSASPSPAAQEAQGEED